MPTGEVVRKKDASKVAATGGAKAAGVGERKPAASAIKVCFKRRNVPRCWSQIPQCYSRGVQ